MWKNRELHPVSVREEQLPDRSKAQASPEPCGGAPWVGCVRPVDLQSSDRARFVNGSWDCPAVGYMACVGLAGRRDPQVGTCSHWDQRALLSVRPGVWYCWPLLPGSLAVPSVGV